VSARIAISVVAATMTLVVPAGARAGGPSPTKVRKAVTAAEQSKELWATVNICNTPLHPRELGLRGEMPSLGFRAGLYMTFEVYYRPAGRTTFKPLRGTRRTLYLGQAAHRDRQIGETYPFKPPAVLAGMITFEWRRQGKVLGRTSRMTTAHHRFVGYADPPGYSAAVCTMT
jgi:hypothetical protein